MYLKSYTFRILVPQSFSEAQYECRPLLVQVFASLSIARFHQFDEVS